MLFHDKPANGKLPTSGEAVVMITTGGPRVSPLGLLQLFSQGLCGPEPPASEHSPSRHLSATQLDDFSESRYTGGN